MLVNQVGSVVPIPEICGTSIIIMEASRSLTRPDHCRIILCAIAAARIVLAVVALSMHGYPMSAMQDTVACQGWAYGSDQDASCSPNMTRVMTDVT